jgi:hypothetical protein
MSTNEFTTTSGRYLVKSHGNGWAYTIVDQTTGETAWAQDHDADYMAEITDAFEDEPAIADFFAH